MTKIERYDEFDRITPLGELLCCPRCGKKYIEAYDSIAKKKTGHLFKPSCNCIKKEIRLCVG